MKFLALIFSFIFFLGLPVVQAQQSFMVDEIVERMEQYYTAKIEKLKLDRPEKYEAIIGSSERLIARYQNADEETVRFRLSELTTMIYSPNHPSFSRLNKSQKAAVVSEQFLFFTLAEQFEGLREKVFSRLFGPGGSLYRFGSNAVQMDASSEDDIAWNEVLLRAHMMGFVAVGSISQFQLKSQVAHRVWYFLATIAAWTYIEYKFDFIPEGLIEVGQVDGQKQKNKISEAMELANEEQGEISVLFPQAKEPTILGFQRGPFQVHYDVDGINKLNQQFDRWLPQRRLDPLSEGFMARVHQKYDAEGSALAIANGLGFEDLVPESFRALGVTPKSFVSGDERDTPDFMRAKFRYGKSPKNHSWRNDLKFKGPMNMLFGNFQARALSYEIDFLDRPLYHLPEPDFYQAMYTYEQLYKLSSTQKLRRQHAVDDTHTFDAKLFYGSKATAEFAGTWLLWGKFTKAFNATVKAPAFIANNIGPWVGKTLKWGKEGLVSVGAGFGITGGYLLYDNILNNLEQGTPEYYETKRRLNVVEQRQDIDLYDEQRPLYDAFLKGNFFPELSRLLQRQDVTDVIMDPNNYYFIHYKRNNFKRDLWLTELIEQDESEFLRDLEWQDPKALNLVFILLNIQEKTTDEKKAEVRRVFKLGLQSALFREMIVLTMNKIIGVSFENLRDIDPKKLNSIEYLRGIKTLGQLRDQSNRKRETEVGANVSAKKNTYVAALTKGNRLMKELVVDDSDHMSDEERVGRLAHEFWHVFSENDILPMLVNYKTRDDFVWAMTGEEAMAGLVARVVEDQLHYKSKTDVPTCLRGLLNNVNLLDFHQDMPGAGLKSVRERIFPLYEFTHGPIYDQWKR